MMDQVLILIVAILACYGVTEIITSSYVAKGFRAAYRAVVWEMVPKFFSKHMVRWFQTESEEEEVILTDEAETTYDGREVKGYDMIACSMCVGFWASIVVALCMGCAPWFLAVYGGTVFLNRMER